MNNLTICYFNGEEINVFAGFKLVHPEWTFYSKYNHRIKWMDKKETDWSILQLKSERCGGYCSTLGSGEIVSPPITQDLFILQKV